jgi:hypothetical protein
MQLFYLSLACPPRSKKLLSRSGLSLSLHRNILFCISLTLSACLCLYPYISLSLVFVTAGRVALCLSLSLSLVSSTRSKESLSLTCPSCVILAILQPNILYTLLCPLKVQSTICLSILLYLLCSLLRYSKQPCGVLYSI